jgi:signal transduction histidine kinase
MQASITTEIVATGLAERHRFLGGAFAGLTPQVLAIVTALLLMRQLSSNLENVVDAAHKGALATWLWNMLYGLGILWIMAATMLVAIIATSNLGPQRGWKRVVALATAVVLSAGAGTLLRFFNFHYDRWAAGFSDQAIGMISYVWPRYALLGGMLTIVGEFYRREVQSLEATQQAEIDRAAFEREMVEARLEVLQAQIEPHFLFNTLANVRRLYEKDAGAGATMLDNLMRYLEVALPRMRESESTLERDAELLEAFLRIHQIRMGERLGFSIDIPFALRTHPVPPMMLLTLAENAIKHGLNPSPEGGLVRIKARAESDRLILSVADTGLGFAPGSGAGTGLANIRARLAEQFGDNASLALENNDLGGVTATIVLPLQVQA